jgi:mannosyl-glycoprotein endo-beta-N-acetylglucosaminidase
MPLRGTGHSKLVGNDAPYFESLAELDVWTATPAKKLTGVLGFQASRQIDGLESEHRGKLLVNEHILTLITQLS